MLRQYEENKELFGEHPLFPRTPLREWIRRHIPSPKDGYVAEDLDLIFLRYGEAIGKNKREDGQFILCEWKTGSRDLPYAQIRVFGLIDRLLRQGDPDSQFYKGFYQINWDGISEVMKVNGRVLSQEQFQSFLLGKLDISPLNYKTLSVEMI